MTDATSETANDPRRPYWGREQAGIDVEIARQAILRDKAIEGVGREETRALIDDILTGLAHRPGPPDGKAP